MLSINPEYVEKILSGKKLYEFRKTRCKQKVDKIYIYSTSPIMKIVAEAEVEDVLEGSPQDIWKKTKAYSGIKKSFFDEYYKNKLKAFAYKLHNITEYETPFDLAELGIQNAPQSFQYVKN